MRDAVVMVDCYEDGENLEQRFTQTMPRRPREKSIPTSLAT